MPSIKTVFAVSLALLSFATPFVTAHNGGGGGDPNPCKSGSLSAKHKECHCYDTGNKKCDFHDGCTAHYYEFFGWPFCVPTCTNPHPSKRAVARRGMEDALVGALVETVIRPSVSTTEEVSPCKKPTSACPIFYTDEARLALKADEVECINTKTDLDNCGGCTSIGMGQSCVDIPFARNVACVHGKCEIYSCKPGYQRVVDKKTGDALCVPKSVAS